MTTQPEPADPDREGPAGLCARAWAVLSEAWSAARAWVGDILKSLLVVGAACGTDSPTAVPPLVEVAEVAPAPPVIAPPPAPTDVLGTFHLTYYYVINEDEIDGPAPKPAEPKSEPAPAAADARPEQAATSDDPTATASPLAPAAEPVLASQVPPTSPPKVTLYDGNGCTPVAEVSRSFAAELQMQGTGRLRDGRTLNIWGDCRCPRSPCFQETGRTWGTAGTGRSLQPFRTVAVDPSVIPLGRLLYIEALDGKWMPGKAPWGGFRHDGCVSADDTGGGIDGHQIDLFVGRRAHYRGLAGNGGSHSWSKDLVVRDGRSRCERKHGRVQRAQPAS